MPTRARGTLEFFKMIKLSRPIGCKPYQTAKHPTVYRVPLLRKRRCDNRRPSTLGALTVFVAEYGTPFGRCRYPKC
ncbi:hypothetical protein PHSY_005716 [Pseudozyma hubeiensis SY62]|uniref:Uncharacterized protein n=1 Tax=Pseudozyma hubeiensis (strain SY62) TaxID=1305764 RepID=R9PA44_PSEHS|nr:hypothetical protein PHSY_005716 [Pseudozyma hubeiensis SY62]GAC98127.1 hypothetical protein PHSY_005716 [Pseudozyma hubeiensis SY62]